MDLCSGFAGGAGIADLLQFLIGSEQLETPTEGRAEEIHHGGFWSRGDKEIYVTPRRPLGKELRRLDNGTSEGGIDPFHRVRVLKP